MKIAVAMVGGVDSSAAAAILKEQGHELVGFTMQLWNQRRGISVDENGDPLPSRCCSLDDVYDARRVAEELGFPFYVLNLERDFERDVVQPFVSSYLSGETPIPCVCVQQPAEVCFTRSTCGQSGLRQSCHRALRARRV